MPFRLLLLLSIVFAVTAALSQDDFLLHRNDGSFRASVSGVVRDATGHGLANVRVELQDIASGRTITSVFTSPNGTYDVINIPPGEYEIVAHAGLVESRTRASLNMPQELNLRLPINDGSA